MPLQVMLKELRLPTFSQWDQIFPDALMTVAAVDRIIHHATIIEIEGESYRKKQHLKK